MDRSALEERYRAALDDALAASGTRACPPWMQARLPAAIGASMLAAQQLLGEMPEALASRYLDLAPRELVEQQLSGSDPARALLWKPLSAGALPDFSGAVDRVCEILREQAIDPARVIGASNSGELLANDPCAVQLLQSALLASGLPFLGAGPAEAAVISLELDAAGADGAGDAARDRSFDLRLGQHLLHELLHGRAADSTAPYEVAGPPWLVREAAALWLQSRARPRHIFPEVAGEAVPGVSLFVLAGEGFAAALGAGLLLSSISDPKSWRERATPPVADLLACAEWQEWLVRKDAPFARDALRAEAWVKLAFLVREPTKAFAELADRCISLGALASAKTLPSLLDAAERTPWPELSWWKAEFSADESGARWTDETSRAETGLRSLFQENAMAPIFATRPAPLPREHFSIDLEACRIETVKRSTGVFAEPARWIFPPPICRLLRARGAKRMEVNGARRNQVPMLAAALVALARDRGGLSERLVLDARALLQNHAVQAKDDAEGRWTSSPP